MRIRKWTENKTKYRPKQTGYMINVTKKEAAQLIESLSHQLVTGNCNGNRMESFTRDNEYFSIAVNDKLEANE